MDWPERRSSRGAVGVNNGTLAAIHIHPVKACHRIELDQATVSNTGLKHDREWQVISNDLAPITQRQHPVMATVQPEIIPGGLRLSAPGHQTIEVARPTVADARSSSMTKTEVDVGDAGDEAGQWFSQIVGQPVRLVALVDNASLTLPKALNVAGQSIAFGDIGPVVVASNASLEWLLERSSEPFTMDRFRPNLVVDAPGPFVEDEWDRFSVGAASLKQAMPWPRCAVPQVDQESGERHREPAKVLKQYRWCQASTGISELIDALMVNSVLFGIGCSIAEPGTVITVGDAVIVDETRTPLIPSPLA